ncbi:MAG: S-methyl-5'-thioadenosine phosphorylase, partial [Chloroflexi bacterium]|nr:S-methyl-5'-thioadenosine phosphorylase [Chloroflexota bacterium]
MKDEVTDRPVVGVIGGTGVYEMDGLDNPQWVRVGSAFGEPSDDLLIGDLGEVRLAFLPR